MEKENNMNSENVVVPIAVGLSIVPVILPRPTRPRRASIQPRGLR